MGSHERRTFLSRLGVRGRLFGAVASGVVLLGGGGAIALATAGTPAAAAAGSSLSRAQLDATTSTTLGGTVRAWCVNASGTFEWEEMSQVPHTCADNLILVTANTQGPVGPQGPAGTNGTNGTNGSNGTNGAPGASAVTNITAATQLSNWPDTGGAGDVWALDNWTRTLNVTVENQVNNSHCNGAPACYAVFGTLTDSGTSVPQNGAAAPNNSEPGTITAKNITQINANGTASFQFYATSDAINAKNVPATDNAATQGKLATTTDWGELAFPSGTQFFGPALSAYDWSYSAAVNYVNSSDVAVSCNQTWNDAVNPGDDGQGSADGNITGVCAA